MRTALISTFALAAGCASTVPAGLQTAQQGLGYVDLATDAATEAYVQAVELCKQVTLPACDRLGDPEEVARKAEALGTAYDSTADGLKAMEAAWAEVAPHFEAAAQVVREAAQK